MRFLADENFPSSAVAAVREAGHDVVWVGVTGRGASDADVLAWAVREGRIILTFDKDFGELAKNSRLSGPSGIVLFRVPLSGPRDIGPRLALSWLPATIGLGISRSSNQDAFECDPSIRGHRPKRPPRKTASALASPPRFVVEIIS